MIRSSKLEYVIGIDTGVKTGLAIYSRVEKRLIRVDTVLIHHEMECVRGYQCSDLLVRVEDARQATYKRQDDAHKLKGAGSVMRDAKIWEDFLTDLKIPFEMVRPRKKFTKLTVDVFQRMTGYMETTSSHGRDAAMLVYGY
jgi:hypothetical protein